jgi:TPR repeat protein
MYANGRGVPKDGTEAFNWYRKAVDQYRKAADRGDAAAQVELGNMYKYGQGVAQNYAETAKWYRKAADRGDAKAQFDLGRMYEEGQGVPQDYLYAHMWFNLAAAHQPGWAKGPRDLAVTSRDAVAAKLTPVQIAEAQRRAREWKPQ